MKKNLFLNVMLFAAVILFAGASFTSCKKDKEDKDPIADNAKIIGVWTGYNKQNTLAFVIGFYPDNTMKASMIYTDKNNNVQNEESEGTYRYNAASDELIVNYSDGGSDTFRLTNRTSVSFTLYISNEPFYMKKGSSSSSTSGSSGGSSSGSTTRTKCKYCQGSGYCSHCHGSGYQSPFILFLQLKMLKVFARAP